jgi:hypothetical protein
MEANSHGLSPERIRHHNSETAHLLSLYLNLLPDIITPDAIEELARDIGVPREAAYALMLATMCGLDTAGRDRLYFEEYFLPLFFIIFGIHINFIDVNGNNVVKINTLSAIIAHFIGI